MKLSELAAASDTSVASIKFYIREGLLPPGKKKNATTAVYAHSHVERLHLIAALRQIVRLPIDEIATLTALIDDPQVPTLRVMESAQIAASGFRQQDQAAVGGAASTASDALIHARGWPPEPTAARRALEAVLTDMARFGIAVSPAYLESVAVALEQVSTADLDLDGSRDKIALHVAVGTHQYSRLTLAVLRLAQTSQSIQKFTAAEDGTLPS